MADPKTAQPKKPASPPSAAEIERAQHHAQQQEQIVKQREQHELEVKTRSSFAALVELIRGGTTEEQREAVEALRPIAAKVQSRL